MDFAGIPVNAFQLQVKCHADHSAGSAIAHIMRNSIKDTLCASNLKIS